MPSVYAIVTRGFGTFAGVADVPTRGFGTGAAPPAPAVVDVGGRGNWNLNKRNPPKRGKTIRFSDFETQEEFAAAMREVIRIPMAEVSDAPVIATDDDEDDELLLLAVMRILH